MKLTKGPRGAGVYRYERPLPDGDYRAIVLAAKEGMSRQGNPMIVITFGIDGPEGGVRIDHHVVTYHSVLVEQILCALAPELLPDWDETEACDLQVETLKNRICTVRIENALWNGAQRPRLSGLFPHQERS